MLFLLMKGYSVTRFYCFLTLARKLKIIFKTIKERQPVQDFQSGNSKLNTFSVGGSARWPFSNG